MPFNWINPVEITIGSKELLLEESSISTESYYLLKRKSSSSVSMPSLLTSQILRTLVKKHLFRGLSETHISYFERSQVLSDLKSKGSKKNLTNRQMYIRKLYQELVDLEDNAVSENAPPITYYLWLSLITKVYFALSFEVKTEDYSQLLIDEIDTLLSRAHHTDGASGYSKLEPLIKFKKYAESLTIFSDSIPIEVIKRNRFVLEYLGHNTASAYFMWAVKYKEGIGGFDLEKLLSKALFEAESLFKFTPDNAGVAWNCLAWASHLKNDALCEIWASRLIELDPKVSDFSGGTTVPGKSMKNKKWFEHFIKKVAPKMLGEPYYDKGETLCAA